MKALLLTEYKHLELSEIPVPEISADDLLIQVQACGICGSDIHGWDGSSGRRIPPLVMGHEASGIVAAVGSNVSRFSEGDRVTFDSMLSCGNCWYCRKGTSSTTFARLVALSAETRSNAHHQRSCRTLRLRGEGGPGRCRFVAAKSFVDSPRPDGLILTLTFGGGLTASGKDCSQIARVVTSNVFLKGAGGCRHASHHSCPVRRRYSARWGAPIYSSAYRTNVISPPRLSADRFLPSRERSWVQPS